jgi:hypothetical protein
VDEDYAGEVFEVDLVDDAGVGRDDGEVAESGLSPAEEGVALFVALEFEQRVHVEGAGGAEFVDLDGVIDYEFDGLQRIDEGGIAAELLHGVAHGGEVDDAGDAGEILKEDAAGSEGDFFFGLGIFVPGGEARCLLLVDVAAVFGAQKVFEQDAQGERKMFGGDALLVEGVEAVDFVFLVANFKRWSGL